MHLHECVCCLHNSLFGCNSNTRGKKKRGGGTILLKLTNEPFVKRKLPPLSLPATSSDVCCDCQNKQLSRTASIHIPFDISEVIKRTCCSGGNRVSKITIRGLYLHDPHHPSKVVPVHVARENGGTAPIFISALYKRKWSA